MNLITDPWIWAKRKSGKRECITPAQATDSYESDPFIMLDHTRVDFNGILIQYLIALYQTALAPRTKKEWKNLSKHPRTPKQIETSFKKYTNAFNLDTGDARFMQEYQGDLSVQVSVFDLYPEKPGEIAIKNNRDFLVPRDKIQRVCRRCAAAGLYGYQISSGGVGSGYRPCIRNKKRAAITTIARGKTLWETIWFNISIADGKTSKIDPKLFSWLAPSVLSTHSKGISAKSIEQSDMHPYHCLWEMPKRVTLDISDEQGLCDICGDTDDHLIYTIHKERNGQLYQGWTHPLSPTYEDKKFVATSAGCTNFNRLIGFYFPRKKIQPAPVIDRLLKDGSTFDLWVFGYESKDAKLYSYISHIFKTSVFKDHELAQKYIQAASIMAWDLYGALKSMGINNLDLILSEFYGDLERSLYNALERELPAEQWLSTLARAANRIYKGYTDSQQRLDYPEAKKKLDRIYYKILPEYLDVEPPGDHSPFYTKRQIQKQNHLSFYKEGLTKDILSWWRRLQRNPIDRDDLMSQDFDTASRHPQIINFLRIIHLAYPDQLEIRHRRNVLAAIAVLLVHIKENISTDQFFEYVREHVVEKRFSEIMEIEDIAEDWKKILDFVYIIHQQVDVIRFVEDLFNWDEQIKRFWKRNYK